MGLDAAKSGLLKGEVPQNSSEIAVSERFTSQGNTTYRVGDVVKFVELDFKTL